MTIELHRITYSPKSTIGILAIDGVSQFYTLEPPTGPMLMPSGTYSCVKNMSPRMGYVSPELFGVPGHTGERIHVGNSAEDTKGCILIGMNRAPDWISDSQQSFDNFMALTPDEFGITIFDHPAENDTEAT